jgi:hypothetical protein
MQQLYQSDTQGFSEPAALAAVQRLIDLKVLVRVSGRLLALAIRAPFPDYFANLIQGQFLEMHPREARLLADTELDQERPNLALACVKRPEDQSMAAWLAPRLEGQRPHQVTY